MNVLYYTESTLSAIIYFCLGRRYITDCVVCRVKEESLSILENVLKFTDYTDHTRSIYTRSMDTPD